MQLEVILPLVAYLVVVFGISVYAMRKRSTGTFLNEYFLGSRSMGGIVLAMTLTATYISASSFIGGPGAAYKYGFGLGIAGDDSASCGLAFARYSRQEVRDSCAPLQCGDAERYAICPLPESSAGVAGEFKFAGCVRWCDDRAVYRRCASAGNRGGYPL